MKTPAGPIVPVLCYHSVASSAPPSLARWTMDPSRFREHLALLADRSVMTPTVSEYAGMLARDTVPASTIVITFDDGFADFATDVVPILEEFGLRATLYATTGYLGGTPGWMPADGRAPMLSREQLAALPPSHVEIGAHGHSHAQLDVVSRRDARDEIRRSKDVLEHILGRSVHSFAYPFGYHSRRVRDDVIAAGYTSACAVKQALSGPGDDVFAIARVLVTDDMTSDRLARILDGHEFGRAPRQERLRVKAWRAARWSRARVPPRVGAVP
jgi:peptidoglycan/xylan/chitin deacetylase (PgdA/CDA1 family)